MDSRILDYRQIHIGEARPDDTVAAEISKRVALVVEHSGVLNVSNIGCVVVGAWTVTGMNRARDACAQCSHPGKGAVGGHEVDRITALETYDRRKLPTANDPVSGERQVVNTIDR